MKKVRGIGINDSAVCGHSCFPKDAHGKKILVPDYAMWYAMLVRCTCEKTKAKFPTYFEAHCDESWLLRSNFKFWYDSHESHKDNTGSNLELDKDILFKGNKEYSSTLCALVPNYLNVLIKNQRVTTSGFLWVSERSKEIHGNNLTKRFRVEMSSSEVGKHTHVGYFRTPEAAHEAAQKFKSKTLMEVLENKYVKEKSFREDIYLAVANRAEDLSRQALNGEPTIQFF